VTVPPVAQVVHPAQPLRDKLTRSCARRNRYEDDAVEADDDFDDVQDTQLRAVLIQIRQRVDFARHSAAASKWVYYVRKRNNRPIMSAAASSIVKLCHNIQERFGSTFEDRVILKTRD